MSHPATASQPARQVERIREILVGRQMQEVEQRLDRLEQGLQPMPAEADGSIFDTQLEAFRRAQEEQFNKLKDEIDADRLRQLEETRRLALQIQSVARTRNEAPAATQELEQRLSQWLGNWQQELQQYLKQREDYLIANLRAELDKLREWTRAETARLSAPGAQASAEKYQQSFERLAEFARSLADELKTSSSPHP